ncbi:MAG: hypothetical protein JW712_04955 [Dehalococcoidales bacterium]|nr:hypothetical protein [Dehalococcoidales bacterium]
MNKLIIIAAAILMVVPMLSCTPDNTAPSPSDGNGYQEIESFSIGTPVLDMVYIDGEIWAATSKGVFRCNPQTGKFIKYTEADGLGNNAVSKITSDSSGNIWVTFHVDGVGEFDGTAWQHFTVEDGLVSDQSITLAGDNRGGMWVSAYWGVSYYNGTKWEAYTSVDPDAPVTGGENPNNPDAELVENAALDAADVIFIDSRDRVWFSHRNVGVTCYDGENWTIFSSENGMEALGVSTITEDEDGNLWFGSYRALTSYDGSQFTSRTIERYKDLIPPPYIQDIKIDTRGDIWIAAYGGGVCHYDGKDWQVFKSEEGLPGENGRFIFFDMEGNPGVVMAEGISFLKGTDWKLLTENDGIPGGKVRVVTIEDTGEVWFGSETGEISRLTR